MGGSTSQLAIIKAGFDEVATKCKWKKGLVVGVQNCGRFAVVSVRKVNTPRPPIRIEERPAGIFCIYMYAGGQAISDDGLTHESYEITTKFLQDVKTGSGMSESNKSNRSNRSNKSNRSNRSKVHNYHISHKPTGDLGELEELIGHMPDFTMSRQSCIKYGPSSSTAEAQFIPNNACGNRKASRSRRGYTDSATILQI